MNAMIRAPLEGELLAPGDTFTVRAAMHPFGQADVFFDMPVGSSLDEVVNEAARRGDMPSVVRGAVVEVDGYEIEPDRWPRVRVKAGHFVFVRAKAKGSFFKTILQLALVVLAAFVAGPIGIAVLGAPAAAIASTAILIGGTLLLNALFPPASAKSDTKDPTYSISGTRNEVSKWGPIPVVFGKIKFAPKFASSPYTEFVDDDQFVRNLYVLAQGPVKITKGAIGETSFDKFDDIETEIFEGRPTDGQQTLYPSQVVQDDYSVDITKKDSPITRTTGEDASEIQFDILAPQGVCDITYSTGKKKRQELVGTAQLLDFTTKAVVATIPWDMSDNDTNPKRKTFRFPNLPGTGQYDLVINRTTRDYDDSDQDESDNVDNITLTAVRTFRKAPAILYGKPLALAALRIRATKQLNGNPDDVNFEGQALAPVWTGSAWDLEEETANCASMGLLALMGQGMAAPKTFAEIDNASWVRFWQFCDLYGFTFNMYRDFTSSVYDTLAEILAAGRGIRIDVDGRIGVAFEDPAAPVKQHFTPRNSSDLTLRITYDELPHGLRCKFVNELKGYTEDEKLVFFDGYSKTNATLYVEVEFPGVTHPDLIYKHARYRIAEMLLRPSTITITTDFEHLVVNRGDRVRVSHDIIQEEMVATRVTGISNSNGLYTVTVDEPLPVVAGKSYGIRIRTDDGASRFFTPQFTVGETNSFRISGTSTVLFVKPGDLAVFGLAGQESEIYRVLRIHRMADLKAEIELVDDAPEIMAADHGPIPPGPGEVVTPPPLADFRPYDLSVQQFVDTVGAAAVQITRLFWKVPPGGPAMTSYLAVAIDGDGKEYRATSANGTTLTVDFINLPTSDYTIVVQGFTADGRYTGFSEPFYLSQLLDDDVLGVGWTNLNLEVQTAINSLGEEGNAKLEEIRLDLQMKVDAAVAEAQALLESELGAAILNEQTTRSNADGVLGQRIDTVKAVADGAAAAVTSETTARTSADGALGQRIDSTLAVANDAVAKVGTEATARASADGALSTSINNNVAFLAGKINGVESDYKAAVQTEQTARVSADNALSQSITSVLAQTNSVSASGFYRLVATGVGSNGHAKFDVNLNAGTAAAPRWAYAGFSLEAWIENNQPRSRAIFAVSQFAVGTPGGVGVVPFIISGGVVYIDNARIKDLDVNNLSIGGVAVQNIANGAVSDVYSAEGDNQNIRVAVPVSYGKVLINVFVYYQPSKGGVRTFSVVRDGVNIRSKSLDSLAVVTGENGSGGQLKSGALTTFSWNFVDYPPVGNHNYDVASSGIAGTYGCTISVTNLKK